MTWLPLTPRLRRQSSRRPLRNRWRPRLEPLEDRWLLAVFTVTVNDDVPGTPTVGSLRWAILQANAASDLDTINFNISAGSPTITPVAALPALAQPVIIDATT